MIQIKQSHLEAFLLDPVLAAYAIMGAELDTFQQARLRIYWFVPEVVDSSGVSTGKTIVDFVYLNLRCLLLTDHIAAIYFPNFQVGKDEFWPYFDRYIQQSSVYQQQFTFHHGKVGEHKYPGAWVMDYKNGSRLVMPAPNFLSDSLTQASRRFNTLVVDDWLRAEDMGEGISKQLVDRTTRPSFNKNHPIWCNHQKFLGHAERPSHKGYTRVRAYKRAILDGSQRHALISFNFEDWSVEFAKKYREDNVIASQKAVLPADQFERQWLGIWSRDGSNYYPETTLQKSCRSALIPCFGRIFENEINTLGVDIAAGQSLRADWSSIVVYRMVEVNRELELECLRKGIEVPPVTKVVNGLKYYRSFAYAYMMKNLDAAETSAFVHMLHRVFAFSRIILDPGGGGLWIYKELKKETQIIGGAPTKVIPLCTREELIQADKQPIVCFFKRGSELDATMPSPHFLTSDEGFIEATHRSYREAWEAGEHHWPLSLEDRAPSQIAGWTRDQVWAQKIFDMGMKQLTNVRQLTDSTGRILTSKRGFSMFEAKGKKDVAYASLYAHAGGQLSLLTEEEEEEEPGACMGVGN